jgi:hypothetical protein
MNGKNRTADRLLVALLLLVLGIPAVFAAEPPAGAAGDAGDAEQAGEKKAPETSPGVELLGHLEDLEPPAEGWFLPDPTMYNGPYDPQAQLDVYGGKYLNKTAQMPLDWGVRLYDRGAYTPRPVYLGTKNPVSFHLNAYGDLRTALAYNDDGVAVNGKTEQSTLATRLNLDIDAAFTATERVHMFIRPLDKNGSFLRYDIDGGVHDKFTRRLDFNVETFFFEGDLGAMAQGASNKRNGLDLPITLGRVPLFTQNGIWLADTFDGAAFAITAKHSARFDISNYDLTFFAGFDKVTTAAAPTDDSKVFGFAGFADAFKGYVEFGYGYLKAKDDDLSYHNLTAAFSKRYHGRLANTVRVIGNFGQQGIAGQKTADGVLLLIENSLVPRSIGWEEKLTVLNFVPYFNLFAGFKNPQPLARAEGAVLQNTGINFETDGLTGYPTLDAKGNDSYGGAVGLEYLFNLHRQVVIEGATVQRTNSNPLGSGSDYALGFRFQQPITNAWILRFDTMHGWREGRKDILGARVEFRRKL